MHGMTNRVAVVAALLAGAAAIVVVCAMANGPAAPGLSLAEKRAKLRQFAIRSGSTPSYKMTQPESELWSPSTCPAAFPHQSATLPELCYSTAGYAAAGTGPCGSWCTRDTQVGAGCPGSNTDKRMCFQKSDLQRCPTDYPYRSSTLPDLCYSESGYAEAGTGPCGSWCTYDIDVGVGCGSNANRMCGVRPSAMPVDLREPLKQAPSYNRNTGAQALDGAVRDLLNKNTPFRSYLVLQDGEIVAEWNSTAPAAFAAGKGGPIDYGYFQRMGLDIMDTTIGDVYSVTKTFTGMLFGVMMEDPSVVLDLDETLGQIFIDAPEPGCSFDLSPEVAKDKKCNCLDPIATGCNLDWGSVPDAEKKKNITIKELLTMTSGLTSPKPLNPFNGKVGGANLLLSFADPFFDAPNMYPWHSVSGTYTYLSSNNILSYVIWAKTGKTPKEYAESSKVLEKLGIDPKDIPWEKNQGECHADPTSGWKHVEGIDDGVETSLHGLHLSTRSMAKIGQMYLQQGKSSNEQVLSSKWVDTTVAPASGDIHFFVPGMEGTWGYGYMMWLHGKRYCAAGHGGQWICVDPSTKRVVVTRTDGFRCSGKCFRPEDFHNFPMSLFDVYGAFVDLALKLPSSSFDTS